MIRYNITKPKLLAQINRQKADWQARALAATACYRQAGKYGEPGDKLWNTQIYGVPPRPFWGQIKAVYMGLQQNKCAFCERKLTVRTKDHDVEHFRPKRGVEVWPPPGNLPYSFSTGQAFLEGYYLLAYHPLNYVAACEHCNRGLKRSYFPIEGVRISGKDSPTALRSELPLLIYPLGQIDTDPEYLIGFKGIIPVPRNADSNTHDNHRAQVTIDLFALQGREELRRERAEEIETIYNLLLLSQPTSNQKNRRQAQRILRRKKSNGNRHTNCVRCFIDLYQKDPAEAERLAKDASNYLETLIPAD